MKYYLLILGIVLFVHHGRAIEKLHKVVVKNKANKIKEVYYTINPISNIKEGSYTMYYSGREITSGKYLANKRQGTWTFHRGTLKISGSYNEGKKEGKWFYVRNADTLAILNFHDGEYVGRQYGYFENGILAVDVNYSYGKRDGKEIRYFDNGKTKEISEYSNGKRHGDNIFYNQNGDLIYKFRFHNDIPVFFTKEADNPEGELYTGIITNGNGQLKIFSKDQTGKPQLLTLINVKDSVYDGEIAGFDIRSFPCFKGQYEKGFLSGEWHFFDSEGKLKQTKTYHLADSLVEDVEKPETKKYIDRQFIVQNMPEFPGGDYNLKMLIAKGVKYPVNCFKNNITGRVFVQFIVNTTGELELVKVVKKVHPEIDAEAQKVLENLPPWLPGFQDGIPVRVSYTIPINFEIN